MGNTNERQNAVIGSRNLSGTPTKISYSGSAYDYNNDSIDYSTTLLERSSNGINEAKYSVKRRNVVKAELGGDNNGGYLILVSPDESKWKMTIDMITQGLYHGLRFKIIILTPFN